MPHHQHKKECVVQCDAVPPWSEIRVEPDTQWCPEITTNGPIQKINVPFYNSSEDPAPQWVGIPICCRKIERQKEVHEHKHKHKHAKKYECKHAKKYECKHAKKYECKHAKKYECKHGKKHGTKHECKHECLRELPHKHKCLDAKFKDDIIGYVYGHNPLSNTTNAGGYHFQ
jgi:hypothetical protein